MTAITKKETRLKLEFVANADSSIHAGLVAVEAMARRFDLWNKVRQHSCLAPHTDQQRGYGPEIIVSQLIYALCSGGAVSLDRAALNDDPLARELSAWGSSPINRRSGNGCGRNPRTGWRHCGNCCTS